MPEPESVFARIPASRRIIESKRTGRWRHLSPEFWNTAFGPTTSVVRPSEPHPWYCSTFKPAFQSVTYISPSVVT